jgi:sulfur carrier protein
LKALLRELGLDEKPVVVELNREALAPSEFETRELCDGDQLEVITIAAGG